MADEQPQQPKQPSLEDLQAIAQRAMDAAERAENAAEAQRAAPAAAEAEANARGLELPPEVLSQITTAVAALGDDVVAKLRSEFEVSANPLAPVTDVAPESAASSGSDSSPQPDPTPDPSPGKKTFAERFLGM